jgi:hypothetical protein
LKRTRADHVGENVIVLVTPTPIEGLTITDKAQKLSAETLAQWEKSWGAQSGRLEMTNGAGKSWTKQEREAGADGTRSMTEAEPAPQTLYYRPGVGSKDPVLIKVQLTLPKKSSLEDRDSPLLGARAPSPALSAERELSLSANFKRSVWHAGGRGRPRSQ